MNTLRNIRSSLISLFIEDGNRSIDRSSLGGWTYLVDFRLAFAKAC